MNSIFSKRLWILCALTAVGFASAMLVPDNPPLQDSRLSPTLGDQYGAWAGQPEQIGSRERAILAADTTFLRKRYTHQSDQTIAPISLSVVFSGKDMNNSIHRPEVCLRTQGWNFLEESTILLDGILPNGEILPMRRIVMEQPIMTDGSDGEERKPLLNEAGDLVFVQRIQYYTFLGADTITASHWSRVFGDMADRLRYGYDQKWAYATFSMEVLGRRLAGTEYESFGRDLEQTDLVMQSFVATVGPNIIGPRKHP